MKRASDRPKVSVLTLVYQHAPYVEQCLKGCLEQQCDFEFEVLLHDDASTDGSAEIVERYAAQYPHLFKPILQQENQYSKGISISRRFQLPRSEGSYLAFCEGDDYWCDPNKLQRQADYLDTHPECSMVYGSVQYLYEPAGRLGEIWGGAATTDLKRLLRGNCIPTPTVMIRRVVVEDFFREMEPEKHRWGMGDYPLWLYAATRGTIHFDAKTVAVYRILPESASHTHNLRRRYNFRRNSLRVQRDFIEHFDRLIDSETRIRAYKRGYGSLYRMAIVLDDQEMIRQMEEFYRHHAPLRYAYIRLFKGVIQRIEGAIYRKKGYTY